MDEQKVTHYRWKVSFALPSLIGHGAQDTQCCILNNDYVAIWLHWNR